MNKTIRLNPRLDPRDYAAAYARDGMVQVPDLLDEASAEWLELALEHDTAWHLSLKTPEGGKLLSPQDMQAMGRVWDVRSGAEYRRSHIPEAISIGDALSVLRNPNTEDFIPVPELERILGGASVLLHHGGERQARKSTTGVLKELSARADGPVMLQFSQHYLASRHYSRYKNSLERNKECASDTRPSAPSNFSLAMKPTAEAFSASDGSRP